ncbi:MAG: FAD-dependent thymidylate synthase [Oscillospiraceae bacterium]
MKVLLIANTANPERVVAAAAKLCYSNSNVGELYEGLTTEKSREFIEMLGGLGHESPTEHASFTFAIEGVSRALLAQITRHRIASYSVQSQRYVKLDDFKFVVPPEVEKNANAKEAFLNAMKKEAQSYCEITEKLKETHKQTFLQEGCDEKTATRMAEKKAIEDARFVLPNACETKMVVTMNARSLNNFFRLRCCNRAQWEIRALADEMLKLVYPVAPALFKNSGSPCAAGVCTEGKMTCGQRAEMQKKYETLKKEALQNG